MSNIADIMIVNISGNPVNIEIPRGINHELLYESLVETQDFTFEKETSDLLELEFRNNVINHKNTHTTNGLIVNVLAFLEAKSDKLSKTGYEIVVQFINTVLRTEKTTVSRENLNRLFNNLIKIFSLNLDYHDTETYYDKRDREAIAEEIQDLWDYLWD